LEGSVDAVPGVGFFAVPIRDTIEAVENSTVMRRVDLWIFVQSASNDAISVWRIDMMENFVGPHAAGGRGFIESFVVVGHDLSFAELEVDMMPGLILPSETSGGGGLRRKRSFELKRLAGSQMGEDKMQFARCAGSEARASPLRGNQLSVRTRQRDR